MKGHLKELKKDLIEELYNELSRLKKQTDKPVKEERIHATVILEGKAAKIIRETVQEKRKQGKSRYGYKSAIQYLICELEEYRNKYQAKAA